MWVVVADATPLHYLILIGAIQILPRIFEKIHVPIEVRNRTQTHGPPADVMLYDIFGLEGRCRRR
jgi:predicted nucleic acid-binding protein